MAAAISLQPPDFAVLYSLSASAFRASFCFHPLSFYTLLDPCQSITSNAKITKAIDEIYSVSSSLASSVEEQSTTVNEVNSRMQEIREKAHAILQNIMESLNASKLVATNAEKVEEESNHILDAAGATKIKASELNQMASELEEIINKFQY